jgi:hypothetical protein
MVETTPDNPLQIRKNPADKITLLPDATTPPPPIQLFAPLETDLNRHRHPVAYALKVTSPMPVGAFGFFARLTSNVYNPSEPFLIVINNINHITESSDYSHMLDAALAINAAAAAGIPGDYNNDGTVDAADYTVWRNHFGELSEANIHQNGDGANGIDLADYAWWKERYGTLVNSTGAGGVAASIPEPKSHDLAWLAAILAISVMQRTSVGIRRFRVPLQRDGRLE